MFFCVLPVLQLDELSGGPGDPLAMASQAIGEGGRGDSALPPGTVADWQKEAESVLLKL